MNPPTKRQNNGVSTVFGSILFILTFILVASTLFYALSNYNENIKASVTLEQTRNQERIILIGMTTYNTTGTELINAISINNAGSITSRIRAVYIDDEFRCDPSDFTDTYINAKETKWINLIPANIEYNKTAKITLTTERGVKAVEYEGKLKGETETIEPTEVQKVYFGPLLLNFEKFYYTEAGSNGVYNPNSWKPGWSVEKGITLVWNVTVTNIDDRDITINQFSCFTLETNDGSAAQKPWYIEPPGGANTLHIASNETVHIIYIWDTARTTAMKTQSVYQQPCRSKVFLTFFGVFHEPDGTTKPYGQTIPFEAVLIREPLMDALNASPTIIAANSTMTSTITVTVRNIYGDLAANTSVQFSTTLGTVPSSTATNANGVATVTLSPGPNTGTAIVTATSGGVSKSTNVTIAQGTVTATASPTIIAANSTMTSTITVTVRLGGNAVRTSPVNFSTTLGNLSATTRTTDNSGVATVTLSPGPTTGTATITATWMGISNTTTVTIAQGTVTLLANPDTIAATSNTTSTITATVRLGGNPVANSQVTFTTTRGSLSASSAQTNSSGTATVYLTAGPTTGTATITATWQGIPATATVNIVEGAVIVSKSQNTIPAGSNATSTITALIRFNGNPLPNTLVGFSTNLSTLSSPTTITDSNGIATVTLYPGTNPGNAIVTATWRGITNTTTVRIAQPTITLTASPTIILVNSTTTSTITATIKLDGNPIENTTVDFTTNLSTLTATSATTNATGAATTNLYSGATSGTATVRATWEGLSNTTTVIIAQGTVTVIASPTILPAGSTMNSTITAIIRLGGTPVPNAPINFSTTLGRLSATSAITNSSGIATVTLYPETIQDTANITAVWQSIASSVNVTIAEGTITFSASPTTIATNSTMTSTIKATIRINGTAIINTPVAFSTDLGTLTPSQTATDADGNATTTLSPGPTTGTATITATWQGLSNTTTIRIGQGTVTLNASPTTITAGSNEAAQITAIITLDGTPVNNAIVNFSTDLGTLNATSATTDNIGNAYVTLIPGNIAGNATITATWQGISQTATVNIAPATVTVSASPNTILVNSATMTSSITTLITLDGNPAANEQISFSTNLGTLSSPTATTDSNGYAVVTFTAGPTTGTATITATWKGISSSATVNIAQGNLIVTASPATLATGSTMNSTIAALVLLNGIPQVNTPVTFSTNMSGLSSTTATTNASGIATITLFPGATPGTANVSASWQDLSNSTIVNIVQGTIVVSAAPNIIAAASSMTSTITAHITLDSIPVSNRLVTFTTNLGNLSTTSATTNSSGDATVILNPESITGTATITAMWEGISAATDVTIAEGTIEISASQNKIGAGSSMNSTVTVTIRLNGSPVIGEPVTFATTLGNLSSTSETTDANGVANVTLNPEAGTGTANVTATWQGLYNSTIVNIVPAAVTISASPETIAANSTDTSLITAVVYLDGNPLANEQVTFNTTLGTLTDQTATTDISGTATVTLSPGPTTGPAEVAVTWKGVSSRVIVSITGGT
jgi:adhesin/invasin